MLSDAVAEKLSLTVTKSMGKSLWVTEVGNLDKGFNNTITEALSWGKRLHDLFTISELNVFCYWWMKSENNALVHMPDANTVLVSLRSWTIGQFSRFIRPGYIRLNTNIASVGNLFVSAYLSPESTTIVIVCVNLNTSDTSQTFNFANFVPRQYSAYRTSISETIANVENGSINSVNVSFNIKAQSTTTYVITK